jgi:hypothetical protein
MIELVMTLCLLSSPIDCRKERVTFDGGLVACGVGGQVAAAEWLASHPKWRLVRWSCGVKRIEV